MDINIVKLKKYASECSVLYVEDDELIRSETASFLGRFFPNVVLAEDGKLGLEKYKSEKFDVVITDINMPNMNGIEMIEAIKDLHYEQPIIVTSAHNESQYLMSLINLNVTHFVQKPFNNKQFLYVLYKIAEELSFGREQENLKNEIISISKRAQSVVDEIEIGIVIIKENDICMANKAFLNIGGFDSYDTLILEMPHIGVLFEEVSHCVNAETNSELIEELQVVSEEDSKVRIMKDSKPIEYKVTLSKIEDEETYILTFTDITAIHNALFTHEHTHLPTKKFILEDIETLKQKHSRLNVILMSIKNFSKVEKWYGKKHSIEIESRFANSIKTIRDEKMPNAFLGHFDSNQILIILEDEDYHSLYEELKNINISSLDILTKRRDTDVDIILSTVALFEHLDTDKDLSEIDVDLINKFDFM